MNAAWPILLALGLSACSSPAETSGQGSVKGYGVEPVTGNSLSAMLARCSQPGPQAATVDRGMSPDAECDQLHRTLHNQPGNSVAPSATP